MQREERKGHRFVIRCLNVHGLTNPKYSEIYENMEEGVVMCLTETQRKVNDIRIAEHLQNNREYERNGG